MPTSRLAVFDHISLKFGGAHDVSVGILTRHFISMSALLCSFNGLGLVINRDRGTESDIFCWSMTIVCLCSNPVQCC